MVVGNSAAANEDGLVYDVMTAFYTACGSFIGQNYGARNGGLLGSCLFRIAWIYTVFAYFRTVPSLYLLYIFSWIITAVAEIAYFIRVYCRQTVDL